MRFAMKALILVVAVAISLATPTLYIALVSFPS